MSRCSCQRRFDDDTSCCKIRDLPWFAGSAQRWSSASHKSCNRWWELVLQLRPWAAITSVEVTKFAQTKRRAPSSVRCQDNVDFFYVDEIVHREFVPPGKPVNQQFYLNVLKKLRESLRRKRSEKWHGGDWFLHHDNAPHTHTQPWASSSFWLKTKWWWCLTTPIHPTSLLATSFFFVPTDEAGGVLLILQRFNENLWPPLSAFPLKITDNVSSSGGQRWDRCIQSQGEYYEGNWSFKHVRIF